MPGKDAETNILELNAIERRFAAVGGSFNISKKTVKAVDGVSLRIVKERTLGLVGESGCGKTTVGRIAVGLIKPTKGRVVFGGEDITGYSDRKMIALRKKMQIVFQDPFGSLNARMSAGAIIREPLETHKIGSRAEQNERVKFLMETVGLKPYQINRYPHEFSGGQRQRIAIARALSVGPVFLVCDEPVSALDVSVQAQILNLFSGLKEEFALTYLFISHDLSVVKYVSDDICVMYLGKVMEMCGADEIFRHTAHPYTKALLSAMPVPKVGVKRERLLLRGDVSSPIDIPSGCRFHARCPDAEERCQREEPELAEIAPEHFAACHFAR